MIRNKYICLLLVCVLISSCGKKKQTIRLTDELELASVTVNRTFVMKDNSKTLWIFSKAGDRIAIYRMGASVYTAYINLTDIGEVPIEDGRCTIKCPEIKIKGPDYVGFDKRECKFKKIDYNEDRKDFIPEEINKEENKAFAEIKKLKEDKEFKEKLIATAKKSAQEKLRLFIAQIAGIDKDNIVIDF